MYEMTLDGLLRLGSSWYAENEANWMVVEVQVEDNEPEIIINPRCNFKSKLSYYAKSYNDDLTLKSNNKIKIVKFDFVENINEYFKRQI